MNTGEAERCKQQRAERNNEAAAVKNTGKVVVKLASSEAEASAQGAERWAGAADNPPGTGPALGKMVVVSATLAGMLPLWGKER